MVLSFSAALVGADLIVFTCFVVSIFVKIGIPDNLSTTYYLFGNVRKGSGYFFPAVVLFICSTGVPVWISTTSHASPWGSKFTFLPYITLVCLLSVASTAQYKKNKMLTYFHYVVAIIAAVTAVAWISLVAYKLIPIGFFILFAWLYAGIRTKTLKTCPLFWLEIAGFYAIIVLLLLVKLIPVSI